MDNNNLLLKIALTAVILVSVSMEEAKSFEMFDIHIITATRNQITNSIMKQGIKKLASIDNLTDRYDASHLFPGARMYVGFTIEGKLENIIYRFDSGNLFTDVLKFDQIKLNLIEKYGEPTVPPAKDRNNDFEEEFLWRKDEVGIQLVSFKWYVAWSIHVTHQLSYNIIRSVQDAGKDELKASRLQ